MKLNELMQNNGARTERRRVGRGKGEKGQKARSGVSIPATFEGGQLPLYRRLPKRGFSNAQFKIKYAIINVSDLNRFDDGAVVTPEILHDAGLLKNQLDGVKVLGNGTLEKKLTIKAHKFSKEAVNKIEKSGSTLEVI